MGEEVYNIVDWCKETIERWWKPTQIKNNWCRRMSACQGIDSIIGWTCYNLIGLDFYLLSSVPQQSTSHMWEEMEELASTSMWEDITMHVIDCMCEEKMEDLISKIYKNAWN